MLRTDVQRDTIVRPRRSDSKTPQLTREIHVNDLLRIGPAIGAGCIQVAQLTGRHRTGVKNVIRYAAPADDTFGLTGIVRPDLEGVVDRCVVEVIEVRLEE